LSNIIENRLLLLFNTSFILLNSILYSKSKSLFIVYLLIVGRLLAIIYFNNKSLYLILLNNIKLGYFLIVLLKVLFIKLLISKLLLEVVDIVSKLSSKIRLLYLFL